MLRKSVFAIVAVSTSILTATSALAATVNATSGQVSINKGSGYRPVNGSSQAKAGDSVMAGPNGSGTIVYPDGCIINVAPGAVVTVTETSPCSFGGLLPSTDFAIGAAVIGGGVAAAILLSKDNSTSP